MVGAITVVLAAVSSRLLHISLSFHRSLGRTNPQYQLRLQPIRCEIRQLASKHALNYHSRKEYPICFPVTGRWKAVVLLSGFVDAHRCTAIAYLPIRLGYRAAIWIESNDNEYMERGRDEVLESAVTG